MLRIESAKKNMPPAIDVQRDVLPNGLIVVTVPLPHLHTASIVMYARVGSRYETLATNGLSHFLEHMLFRGSKSHPNSFALNYAIEDIGGTLYAETGRDYSLYQISLHPENLPAGVQIFGDIFEAPALTDIDLERKIILEEILEDMDEDGRIINIDDVARKAVWPDHGLGLPITGPYENVERFKLADVQRHFKEFYGASNMVLCVSGATRHDQVMTWAERWMGPLASGERRRPEAPTESQKKAQFVYVENEGSQTAVQVLFRALPEGDPDYVAMQALSRVLDDGMSTRLHYRVCDQKGLAYYVSGNVEPFHDTALFEIDGASAHRNVPALLREVFRLLGELKDKPPEHAELAKAKRRYRWDLEATFDDPDALAGWFGGTELFYRPDAYEVKVARMEAVTAEDVQRVARRLFVPDRLTVAAVGDLGGKLQAEVRSLVEGYR
jgi:predicted Zn-dependent peptidase